MGGITAAGTAEAEAGAGVLIGIAATRTDHIMVIGGMMTGTMLRVVVGKTRP